MRLERISYRGPAIDDHEALGRLPDELAKVLSQINGFIQFGGGLHIRGACLNPGWHSLRHAWLSDESFANRYPQVSKDDIPFGQDCVGDQFLIRSKTVVRLCAETGEIEDTGVGFVEFLEAAQSDPMGFLALEPLAQFQREGGTLQPGQLLSVAPPFCTEESGQGVSLRAISAEDRIQFLADFSRQISGAD